MKVEVVSIDLEIAEISELDEETRAASMLVNDDYDEGNGIIYSPPDVLMISDNNRAHGQIVAIPPGIMVLDDDLTDASLTIDGPNGQTGKYWIEVVGEPQYAQYVLVWKWDGTAVPRTRETAESITLDVQAVNLIIEGLTKYNDEDHPIRLIAHFEPDGDYAKAGLEPDVVDEVMALVGVNKWTHDNWTGERGNYTGTATAGSDYDTLEQLAKNITGRADDAFYLHATEPIVSGTEVDVSELLAILEEERLRKNVVEAANANKAAKFSRGYENWDISLEVGINRIFGIGRPATALPTFECLMIIQIIMARGVIMELMPGEFDGMGLGVAAVGPGKLDPDTPGAYFNVYNPVVAQDALLEGDWAVFWNKMDYDNNRGMWGAENVIKVGDKYWGFDDDGGTVQSYSKWKDDLVYWYNKGNHPSAPITVDDIQGYDDLNRQGVLEYSVYAGFIDVAELAMAIFDYRKAH